MKPEITAEKIVSPAMMKNFFPFPCFQVLFDCETKHVLLTIKFSSFDFHFLSKVVINSEARFVTSSAGNCFA